MSHATNPTAGAESLAATAERLKRHVDRRRLLAIAERLIAVPSPTGRAGAAADALAAILTEEGFAVDRPAAGHPDAPAVVARLEGPRPGRVLQFDGHLDTVHLPFVPPGIDGDRLTGSGASDMKGGLAAAVEALLALRDAGALDRRRGPPDGPRPPRGPLGLRAADRSPDRRRHASATPSSSPSRSATTSPSPAGARRAGRPRSVARGRRSTR